MTFVRPLASSLSLRVCHHAAKKSSSFQRRGRASVTHYHHHHHHHHYHHHHQQQQQHHHHHYHHQTRPSSRHPTTQGGRRRCCKVWFFNLPPWWPQDLPGRCLEHHQRRGNRSEPEKRRLRAWRAWRTTPAREPSSSFFLPPWRKTSASLSSDRSQALRLRSSSAATARLRTPFLPAFRTAPCRQGHQLGLPACQR